MSNGNGLPHTHGASQASRDLSYVIWHTEEPVLLPAGPRTAAIRVHARGDAHLQVRDRKLLAPVGNIDAQVEYIQQTIVDSLAAVLRGMEPPASELEALQEEIASATLVRANTQLSAHGIALLDLSVAQIGANS